MRTSVVRTSPYDLVMASPPSTGEEVRDWPEQSVSRQEWLQAVDIEPRSEATSVCHDVRPVWEVTRPISNEMERRARTASASNLALARPGLSDRPFTTRHCLGKAKNRSCLTSSEGGMTNRPTTIGTPQELVMARCGHGNAGTGVCRHRRSSRQRCSGRAGPCQRSETSHSLGSMWPRFSTTLNVPFSDQAMYVFMRTWCWPGTISAGPEKVSRSLPLISS